MKWNGLGRGLQLTAASLAVALGMTACSRDYTVAYLYVTSATRTTAGAINAYAVDYQSGALTQLADSPIPSGGNNPITLVASPNAKYLYVLNHDAPSSSIVAFSIGTDGKLYPQATTPVVQNASGTPFGTFPTAAAIDPTGSFLYVTFTYRTPYTTASPGPGGVAVYPIAASNGALGAALVNSATGLPYFPVGDNPVGIVVSPKGGYVYVIDDEVPATGSPFGVLLAFTANTSTGALTPIAGPVSGGFRAGTTPSALAEDPSGSFLYVTDKATNQLYGFGLVTGGVPSAILSSPYTTGLYPTSVTIDPRGAYVYVANFGSSTVSGFAIGTGGGLSGVTGGATVATEPTCVTIEPALGVYLFTSNNADNSVSAEQLNPHTGALSSVQNTPFPAQALPTCAVAVANGAHATQLVDSSQ